MGGITPVAKSKLCCFHKLVTCAAQTLNLFLMLSEHLSVTDRLLAQIYPLEQKK